MKKIWSNVESRLTKPLSIFILLVLFILSSSLINGTMIGVAKLLEISGGTSILDLLPGYSAEAAKHY